MRKRKKKQKKSEEKKSTVSRTAVEALDSVGFDLISKWAEAMNNNDLKKATVLSRMFPFTLRKVPKYGFEDNTSNAKTEVFKAVGEYEDCLESVISYDDRVDISIDQDELECKFRCLECKMYITDGINKEDNSDGKICPVCFMFFKSEAIDDMHDKTVSAYIKAWLAKNTK